MRTIHISERARIVSIYILKTHNNEFIKSTHNTSLKRHLTYNIEWLKRHGLIYFIIIVYVLYVNGIMKYPLS